MRENDLPDRTKQFALRVMRLCDALPAGRSGNVIASQLLRSGTSVGANYRAACRARSKAEFISKLGIVEEEVDESVFWLDLVVETNLLPEAKVDALRVEADELLRIMASSRLSAKRNNQQ